MAKKSNKKSSDKSKDESYEKSLGEEKFVEIEKILKQDRNRDFLMKKNLSKFFYWQSLLVIIILNFAAVLVISPFIFILESYWSYALVAIIAFSIGTLLNYLVLSIEHLKLKHHYIALVLIPVLASVDLLVFIEFSRFFSDFFNVKVGFDAQILIFLFVLSFVAPYAYTGFKEKFLR